jgi:hypothetical protein
MDDNSADMFLQGRVAEARRVNWSRSLLEYLGMTRDEYASWFMTGIVPDRVKRVWRLK